LGDDSRDHRFDRAETDEVKRGEQTLRGEQVFEPACKPDSVES